MLPTITENDKSSPVPSASSVGSVTLVARPHPFSDARSIVPMAAGPTLAEMLTIAGVELPPHLNAHVLIDGQLIYREYWRLVRPKPGSMVAVRVIPRGGGEGGKNPLRTILQLAVLATAAFVTTLGPIAALGALGQAAASAAVAIAGPVLVNATNPPRRA